MPLIHADQLEQEPTDRAHEQARKIHPRYARGELQRVTVATNLSEAELIKGVLLEQGIPSLIRRTAGFDVPDFLAAGPRDILVPEAGVAAARELLAEVDAEHSAATAADLELEGGEEDSTDLPPPGHRRSWELRLFAGALAGVLAFGGVVGLIVALAHR